MISPINWLMISAYKKTCNLIELYSFNFSLVQTNSSILRTFTTAKCKEIRKNVGRLVYTLFSCVFFLILNKSILNWQFKVSITNIGMQWTWT